METPRSRPSILNGPAPIRPFVRALRQHRHVVVGEQGLGGGERLGEVKLHRLVVRHLDLFDELQRGLVGGGGVLGGAGFDGPLDVGRRDRLAVVPDGVVAQLEGPHAALVDAPLLGELAAQLAGVVVAEEAAVDHQLDGPGGGAGGLQRCEAGRIGRQAEGEDAGRLRARRGSADERDGARCGRGGHEAATCQIKAHVVSPLWAPWARSRPIAAAVTPLQRLFHRVRLLP